MYAYGHTGEVKITDTYHNTYFTIEDAKTLLKQLPIAIHEAELQQIGQMQLPTPEPSSPSGTL